MSKSNPIRLRLFGAGTRGRVVADFIRWRFADTYTIDGFYDDNPATAGAIDAPRLGSVDQGLEAFPSTSAEAFLALGTYASWRSCSILCALQQRGVRIANLISPMASVSPSASIGPGALVFDGVFIGARARIGALLTANAMTVIEHDTSLGMNVMLGSGVAIAGFAQIADHCFIGTNATILPHITIGEGTLVGAGATVTDNLPAGIVATGAPARFRRNVRDDDEVPSAKMRATLLRG